MNSIFEFPEKPQKAAAPGEFIFAAAGLAHSHIYAICRGLKEAGAELRYVFDENEGSVKQFLKVFPEAKPVTCIDRILEDKSVSLVASADIPSKRCDLGIKVMKSGKDFLADKAPLITLEQLEAAKSTVAETGRKYAVYYSERSGNEASYYADVLINRGVIGDVINLIGTGPHRLIYDTPRPDWFFKRETSGGILIDIGSHQTEQFLHYSKNRKAEILSSRIGNFAHKEYPEFDDFGDCTISGENGVTGYFKTDWFTPGSIKSFGDGRLLITGTKGYIELRKYTDPGITDSGDNIIIATENELLKMSVTGKIGLPFFSGLISDCINRTEYAMTQEHAFYAAELAIKAQLNAKQLTP